MSEIYRKDQEDPTPVCIKYQCTHITCRLECYTGQMQLTRGRFERLKAGAAQLVEINTTLFKSPSMVCKIAPTQDFRVIEFVNDNPIAQIESTNEIHKLEGQRDKLRRSLQLEKETFERKRTEFKENISRINAKLKQLRSQESERQTNTQS